MFTNLYLQKSLGAGTEVHAPGAPPPHAQEYKPVKVMLFAKVYFSKNRFKNRKSPLVPLNLCGICKPLILQNQAARAPKLLTPDTRPPETKPAWFYMTWRHINADVAKSGGTHM